MVPLQTHVLDYDDFGFREINDTRVNVTIHKHKFLSNPQKEAMVAVCPLGGLISWFPIAYAYNQMGFRRCFVLCAILGIVPSVFIPMCTSARTFLLACIVRILQAFFAFPIFSLLAWSEFGWHSVHYLACIATAIFFGIFMLINYDDEFKEKASREGMFNQLVELFVKVVSVPLVGTGLLLTIPPISNTVIAFMMYGLFSQLANSEQNKLRFFNTLGTVPSGILFMLIGAFDPDTQPASVTHHLFLLTNLFLVNCVSMFLTSLFNVLIANNDDYCE
ncbi:hypothetical protein NECAME_02765 [Necator americanus]|uniref:Uncharacterized protein n=1 Tax=Necator americanus TaxID=51031 RepID=W2TCI7_NECAM|nr:hypothetical protein NECAME_02765 [Necator americanus]ETN78901.1 hypothetical protein NECAME_02765 [Necator americanus]